jgi:uncharacterized protein YodC (DUF2158 family)
VGERAEGSDALNFEVGDVVCLKDSILQGKRYSDLVPKGLVKREGFPNEFLVRGVARDPSGRPAVSLFPCCYSLVRRGNYRCRWHLAHLFERAKFQKIKPGVQGEDRPGGEGVRTHSIPTPLDEAVSIEFQDESDPRLNLTCHGIYGQLLRGLFKFGKSQGIL